MSIIALALLAAPGDVEAFCGAYVGGTEDAPLTNRSSRLVVARWEGMTVLSMANDVQGDAESFGLLIPVPAGFDSGNVRLIERALLDRVQGYSEPRLVRYTCDDFYGTGDDGAWVSSGARAVNGPGATDTGIMGSGPGASADSDKTTSSGCAGGGSGEAWWDDVDSGPDAPVAVDTANDVVVDDEFDLGEYTAFVVSAGDGEGLSAWLNENGFWLTEAVGGRLQEYIDGGAATFLALRVDLERAPEGDTWLSPIQLAYEAEGWSLPLRLGAINSAGVQDLILTVLTDPEQGRVGISNYPELPAPASECMLEDDGRSFAERYEALFTEASALPIDPGLVGGASGFAWTTEYSWDSGKCDPCPDDLPISYNDVMELGLLSGAWGWHLTRLHLRYTPDAVTQDIALYGTGIVDQSQVRFFEHRWELESLLPLCGGEEPEEPGACYTTEYWARRAQEASPEPIRRDVELGRGGCGGAAAALLFLPLAGLAARRRRR